MDFILFNNEENQLNSYAYYLLIESSFTRMELESFLGNGMRRQLNKERESFCNFILLLSYLYYYYLYQKQFHILKQHSTRSLAFIISRLLSFNFIIYITEVLILI